MTDLMEIIPIKVLHSKVSPWSEPFQEVAGFPIRTCRSIFLK